MYHIIQENLFKEEHYDVLISTIKKLELPYKIVRVYPFVDWVVDINDIPEEFNNVEDLPQITPEGNIWCWGSLKLTRICKERNWKPGTLINKNHDYEIYSKWWGDLLLNYDSKILTIGDNLPWEKGDLFLRPTKDSKAFTGQIFDKETWENTKNAYLHEEGYPEFTEETKIQVCKPKNIQKEIRLWIIGDKIVTGSYYRLGNKQYLNNQIEPDAIDFGYQVMSKGKIADAWVLDICLSDDKWKVVECGCINHAGFYKSELQKTVEAIENYYE